MVTSGMSLKSYGVKTHNYEMLGSQSLYFVYLERLYYRTERSAIKSKNLKLLFTYHKSGNTLLVKVWVPS